MAQNYEQFSSHFLDEVFKLCLLKKDICEVVCTHLEYSYIPVDMKGYKIILKAIKEYFGSTGKLPSIGMLTQNNQKPEVYEILDRVVNMKIPDKEEVLGTLEEYIKRVRFQKLYSDIAEMYNNGDQKGAIELQAKESQEIVNFSVKNDSSYLQDVFEGFYERDEERFIKSQDSDNKIRKIPFGIDLLDRLTHGGSCPDIGEIDCFLGRSGSGKTKYLRWRGVSAARFGYKVLHIQAEGTAQECMLGYDATWTALLKKDLRNGSIDPGMMKKLDKVIKDIRQRGGMIKVHAYEEFGTASMKDVRNWALDFLKMYGSLPDLIILDYLELFDPGDGRRYSASMEGEKLRREASARDFKNICNELKCSGATASQVNDISPQDFNRVDWYMTRHNVAMAKGLVDPFSYFLTWNVSSDEYNKNLGRLYVDKARDYRGNTLIRMATNYDHDRFYDRSATIKLYPEDYEGK